MSEMEQEKKQKRKGFPLLLDDVEGTSASSEEPHASSDKKSSATTSKKRKKRCQRTWEDSFNVLLQFKGTWGDCQVPRSYCSKDPELVQWAKNQRRLYHRNELSQDRIDKLESAGFSWKVAVVVGTDCASAKKKSQKEETMWHQQYLKLRQFKQQYGHVVVPQHYKREQGETLGRWCNNQRIFYAKGSLKKDRYELLEKMGFAWAGRKGRPKSGTTVLKNPKKGSCVDKASYARLAANNSVSSQHKDAATNAEFAEICRNHKELHEKLSDITERDEHENVPQKMQQQKLSKDASSEEEETTDSGDDVKEEKTGQYREHPHQQQQYAASFLQPNSDANNQMIQPKQLQTLATLAYLAAPEQTLVQQPPQAHHLNNGTALGAAANAQTLPLGHDLLQNSSLLPASPTMTGACFLEGGLSIPSRMTTNNGESWPTTNAQAPPLNIQLTSKNNRNTNDASPNLFPSATAAAETSDAMPNLSTLATMDSTTTTCMTARETLANARNPQNTPNSWGLLQQHYLNASRSGYWFPPTNSSTINFGASR